MTVCVAIDIHYADHIILNRVFRFATLNCGLSLYRRDSFPKQDLDGNFIGDSYPLCKDLPRRHFLRKGAKYRLLGSSELTQVNYEPLPIHWNGTKSVVLSSSSGLYEELCNSGSSGACNFQAEVTLESNILNCDDEECHVEDLRLVQVQSDPPVYYEYVRIPW